MIDLYKGDCLELMKGIESGSIDAIITDPPYGTTACKWDSVIDFDLMWEQLNRIIKPNGAIVLFASQPFTSALVMSNIKFFKYDITWLKERPSNPALAKKRPLNNKEDILLFYKSQPTYNPQMTLRDEKNKRNNKNEKFNTEARAKLGDSFKKTGMNDYCYPKNFIKVNVQRGLHPTQKPVDLMEYLIKTYTNENETVLDFTMGSGSTGVACVNTNRNFIGIEQDENYFEIANQRIEMTNKSI
jgi:site-specific DNA-methyltransferase (adenine-specific)